MMASKKVNLNPPNLGDKAVANLYMLILMAFSNHLVNIVLKSAKS